MRAGEKMDCSRGRFLVRRQELDVAVDPIGLLAAAPAGEEVFYLERPDAGEAIVAIGSAAEISMQGKARFADASARASSLLSSLVIDGAPSNARRRSLPRLVGGFAFADFLESPLWRDFPACRFVLPRAQWVLSEGRWTYFEVLAADPSSRSSRAGGLQRGRFASTTSVAQGAATTRDETPSEWLARASTVLEAIESGSFDKVVLARRESRALAAEVDVARMLADLRAARPSCYTFCVASGASVFLGSSPEKLVSLRDGVVEADALAGTIARGENDAEDVALAHALAESDKDRREHAVVVDDLRATLTPFVDGLESGATPTTRAFPEGHHLHTSVRGLRADGISVLDLVAAVHPTPAVCGAPRSQTEALVGRLEADRGWYSGGVGWLDSEGDGLFAVALRAGLLADARLTTWAGAGIVAGSDVALELEETALKMRALLGVVEEQAV